MGKGIDFSPKVRGFMKFGGHQSFHLRDQWLYKGLHWTARSSDIFLNTQSHTEQAMQELGIGKNMVDSLKHWLRATHLIKNTAKGFVLTNTARTILNKDPYFELDGTLFLIHYLLTTNQEDATAWHWFFNFFSASEFEKTSLTNAFYSYIQIKTDRKVRETTLEKDLNCLLRMYQAVEYKGNKNPETETPSPFTKYGWIKKQGEGFTRDKLNVGDFNVHVFAHILGIFWQKCLKGSESVRLEELCLKDNSPGRIFQFSLEEMSDLTDLCSKRGYLTYSRGGGYFIIQFHPSELKKALSNYYKEMNV